jgi:Fe-S oxidoreductase
MYDLSKCTRCGDCLLRCHYVDYDRPKIEYELNNILNGKNSDILWDCVTCNACNEYCPQGVNLADLIQELQEKYKVEVVPEKSVRMLDRITTLTSNVVTGDLNDSNKPVLSLCAMRGWIPKGSLGGQMFDDLTQIELGDYFDYFAYLHVGKVSYIKNNIEKFVSALAELGRDEIIFIHDECIATLNMAREWGIEIPFKPINILAYLLNYLKEHKDSIIKLNKKIAYQRPCSSRYVPENELLLSELFDLIGVERVTRRYDRQDALCCGGLSAYYNAPWVKRIQDMNVTDALGYRAEAMVFLCHGCMEGIGKYCLKRGLPPFHVTDLARMALGEMSFPS